MVFSDDNARPAAQAGAPLLGRLDLLQPVELSDALQTLIDQLPGAWPIRSDLATVFPRSTAGAVE